MWVCGELTRAWLEAPYQLVLNSNAGKVVHEGPRVQTDSCTSHSIFREVRHGSGDALLMGTFYPLNMHPHAYVLLLL